MSRAVFLKGARDARVGPIELREGQLGETLVEVAAAGFVAAISTILRMAASVQRSSPAVRSGTRNWRLSSRGITTRLEWTLGSPVIVRDQLRCRGFAISMPGLHRRLENTIVPVAAAVPDCARPKRLLCMQRRTLSLLRRGVPSPRAYRGRWRAFVHPGLSRISDARTGVWKATADIAHVKDWVNRVGSGWTCSFCGQTEHCRWDPSAKKALQFYGRSCSPTFG